MGKRFLIAIVVVLMVFISVGCKKQISDPPQPPSITSVEGVEVDLTNMKWICKFDKEFRGMWKESQPVWECYWE